MRRSVTCGLLLIFVTLVGCESTSDDKKSAEAPPRSSTEQAAEKPSPVDQPAECTIDAQALEAAEGLDAGTYNTVEVRQPKTANGVTVNFPVCWYSHDGTAFPSTTMPTATYGTGPVDKSSPLRVMEKVTNAQEAADALAEICPAEYLSPTRFDNVYVCGSDTFAFGATRWYNDQDLVMESSTDGDPNTVSAEELEQMDPVLEFLSQNAQ